MVDVDYGRFDRVSEPEHRIAGSKRRWRAKGLAEKDAAFRAIYWWLRSINEDDARAFVAELCRETGFDPGGLCADLVMTWDEICRLAADPLVTIGAHTRRHFALAKLTLPQAREEIARSLDVQSRREVESG
jgi:hypothetical protein